MEKDHGMSFPPKQFIFSCITRELKNAFGSLGRGKIQCFLINIKLKNLVAVPQLNYEV